jgi:small GTP-binding protein
MIKKKVAMLGAYAVGKTSLVRQFVESLFDEKYHSTIGVKIDEKDLRVGTDEVKLMLWDIAGAEDRFSVPVSYIRGASGIMLVIDGTRPETVARALDLIEEVEATLGQIPVVAVLNKSDLTDQWKLDERDLEELSALGCPQFRGSAKTGTGVEEAFAELATLIYTASTNQ